MVLRPWWLMSWSLAAGRDKTKLGADGLAHLAHLAHQSSSSIISQLSPAKCGAVPSSLLWPQVSRWDGLSAGLIKPSGLWGRFVASSWRCRSTQHLHVFFVHVSSEEVDKLSSGPSPASPSPFAGDHARTRTRTNCFDFGDS